LADNFTFTNQAQPTLIAFRPMGTLVSVQGVSMNELFENQLEIYSGEVQQIFQQPGHNTIFGARAQYGHFKTSNLQDNPTSLAFVFPDPPDPAAQQDVTTLFKRFALYGYHQWELTDWLELIGGLSYDRITFPENFRSAPISSREKTVDQVSPKAGLILRPLPDTVIRFAYTRSLAGASIDQSFQLEPSQVAGFVQSFRSLIPESIAGANAGAKFETYGLSLEQKFSTGTYLGVSGELLNSVVNRADGVFDVDSAGAGIGVPSTLREHLDYSEQSLSFTANQLVGNKWSLGASYRLSRAVLNDDFPGVPNSAFFGSPASFQPGQRTEGVLNNLNLFAIYNHPCGFFAEGEARWYAQHNIGYSGSEPGEEFWQFNIFAGYRFPRRHAELAVGLLNLADQNYKLNPLNIYNELPRERTLAVRLRVNF
jgi:outer membrane receptor protein involved in Fe transport